jgi:hydrogenase expression/formation protein HypC
MCLAVPGKVVEITGEGELRMGKVDFSGVQRQACLAYVPEVELGDYVLVHVGFAISRIEEEHAMETLAALAEMGELAELGTPDDDEAPGGSGPAPRSGSSGGPS